MQKLNENHLCLRTNKKLFIAGYAISKSVTIIIGLLCFSIQLHAQNGNCLPPSGLMCDLVGATNYQSINGYVINPSLANLTDNKVQLVRIGNITPAFSWVVNDKGSNVLQTAYQVLVSDSLQLLNQNAGNIWDSGRVSDSRSAGVLFGGNPLKSNATYYWKIRVWNNHREVSPYSSPEVFHTGAFLKEHQSPVYPLQITEEKPVTFSKRGNVYFADFGRDAFAQLKLRLFSKEENDTLTVRFGEILNANGGIERKPPGTIRYAQYTLVLHRGLHSYKININKNAYNTRPAAIRMPGYIGEVLPFRYCEIESYKAPLLADDLTRLSAHYYFDDGASSFHCSDTLLNDVWNLCKYSVKATSFLGTYVDGDRERTPYEADALINQLSHYAVDREYTMARNSHEYLITHPTWPTEWILQSVLIAWNDYLYTGDIGSVKQYYEDLKAKTLNALADSTHLISTLNGKMTKDVLTSIHYSSGPLKDIVDWPRDTESDGFVFTRYNAVVNAFYYRALVIMEKLASDLGRTADAKMYRQRASDVKKAYQKMFFDTGRKIYVDGEGTGHASLHANAFALAFGLVEKKQQADVLTFIKSKGMACSVYGSQFLLDGLFDAGEGNYGLSLLTSKTDRSWFNMLRVGSTITLEAWDNKYKPNQDWNHPWGAAPANIIARKVMGIEPVTQGWARFSIKPQIGSLSNAQIAVPTIKGAIKALYKQTDSSFVVETEIPANTVADVYLPVYKAKKFKIHFDNQDIHAKKDNQTALIANVGSGKHIIKLIYIE